MAMDLEKFAIESADGLEIKVFIQPRSAKTRFHGLHGDAIKLSVAAPPLEGKANEELCRYFAEEFDVPRRSVTVLSGTRSRHKRVLIKGKTLSDLRLVLTEIDKGLKS